MPSPSDASGAASGLGDEVRRGQRELQEGDLPAAVSRFSGVLSVDAGHRGALVGLAWARRRQGDTAGALVLFRRALAVAPDDPDLLRHVARETRGLGDPDEALALLDRARTLAADDVRVAVERARTLDALGAPEARAAWDEALALDPADRAAVLGAARARAADHDLEGAAALLRRHHAGDRLDGAIALELARLELELGRADAALGVLGPITVDGRATDEQLRRGEGLIVRAHLLLGEYDRAVASIAAGDDADSEERARLAALRGVVAAARWDLRAAEDEFAQALGLDPTPERAKRLAQVRLATIDAPGARQAWTLAVTAAQWGPGRTSSDVTGRGTSGLIGDIINEFLLDPEVAEEAHACVVTEDLERARSLVIAAPGSQAAATSLLVALRRSGRFDGPSGDAATGTSGPGHDRSVLVTPAPIPRILHQAWLGPPVPDDVGRLSERWVELHPEWEHELVDDRAAARILAGLEDGAILTRALRAARDDTMRADLLRLVLLRERGGVWVDADDLPVTAIDPLVAGTDLVVVQEQYGALGNHLIASTVGHPVIAAAVEEVGRNLLDGVRESPWLATGPGPLTRALAGALSREAGTPEDRGRPDRAAVRVLERRQRDAVVAPARRLAYKSTRRWWRAADVPDPARPPRATAPVHDVLFIARAGMKDVLGEAARCLEYAERHGRRLVIDSRDVGLPLPVDRCFAMLPSAAGGPRHLLGVDGWEVPPDADVRPDALGDGSSLVRHVRGRTLRSGEVERDGLSIPVTFDFRVAHPEQVLVHDRYSVARTGRSTPRGRAVRFLERVELLPWLRTEVAERLRRLPDSYDAVHLRNTDLRSDHVPFLLGLRGALAGRIVLVSSDDAGSARDAELLLDDSEVVRVAVPPDVAHRSLHLDPALAGETAAVDLFADLLGLAGARTLHECPTRNGVRSGFAELAAELAAAPGLRRRLLDGAVSPDDAGP